MRFIAAVAILASIVLVVPASAKDKEIDYLDYPEMSKERALPQIVAALRDTMIDATSITNLKICYPPSKVKIKNGKPVQWSFLLSLNAKNSYGGYTGNQGMVAVFYSDKPVWVFDMISALDPKTVAACTRVPDAEIQRLMQAE